MSTLDEFREILLPPEPAEPVVNFLTADRKGKYVVHLQGRGTFTILKNALPIHTFATASSDWMEVNATIKCRKGDVLQCVGEVSHIRAGRL